MGVKSSAKQVKKKREKKEKEEVFSLTITTSDQIRLKELFAHMDYGNWKVNRPPSPLDVEEQ